MSVPVTDRPSAPSASPRRHRTHWATLLHAWVYRRSAGRVLGRIGGQPVLPA